MFEGRTNKIIVLLIFISVFVSSIVITNKPADIYIGYVVFIILLPIFMLKHKFPFSILVIFLILLGVGIFNIYTGNNETGQFIKIFLGAFFSYLFYYYVVVESDFNVEKLFQFYLKGCFIVCVIGIIQFISFKIGFKFGYNYNWILNKWGVTPGGLGIRVNSIFGEPTYFAICTAGGMFAAIYNLIVKKPYCLTKRQSAVICIAYMLSFSGVAYTTLFISILILLINFGFIRYAILFIPVLLGAFYYLYNNVIEFRERYDSTIEVFTTGQFRVGKTHGSSIILYDNYHVAMQNFSNHYFFGTGLGSHTVAFDRFSVAQFIEVSGFNQNNQDASSMLFRLISETGLFGTGIILVILFKCFIKRKNDNSIPEHFWIISGAIFVMMVVNLIRQGNYILNGFPFFVWLYYYNYINYKKAAETGFEQLPVVKIEESSAV